MILPVHVLAGGLAIMLGAVALSVRKGGRTHRWSGRLFIGAMVVMGATASMLGFRKSATDPNVFAGVMTFYFVVTALASVRPMAFSRAINLLAPMFAGSLGVLAIGGGVTSIKSPLLSSGGVPLRTIGVMSVILGIVLLLATAGDLRVLRFGALRGAPRLKRHLWRMCFAMFIAAGSFFSIRERVATILPEPFPSGPMRVLPIVLLFGAMFYWFWKLRGGRAPVTAVIRRPPSPVPEGGQDG